MINYDLKTKLPKITIIGCGAIAEFLYLPAFAKISYPPNRLTLIDINLERAKAMADKFGIKECANDHKSVIKKVDGAIIALPHYLHFDISMDFLRAGVNILCEKPLCETEEQAKIMIQEAKRQEASLCVDNTRRLFPSFKKIKELIDKCAIGRPIFFGIEEGGLYNWPTVSGFYFNPEQAGGGVLMDTGAHTIDTVCWWFGSRPEVVSYHDDSFGGCEAVAEINLKIKGTINGLIKLNRLTKLTNKYIIKGESGSLYCELSNWKNIYLSKNGRTTKISLAGPHSFEGFGLEIVNNFIKVIGGKEKPLISGEDVINSISVIETCYKNRQRFVMPWVEVPQIDK